MNYSKIIYLGSYCNKDCSYCDRGYIKDEIGDQRLDKKDIPRLITFLKKQFEDDIDPLIGFHGGEPFLYTSLMSEIIDSFPDTYKISILTNGTLLSNNQNFLKKYGERLYISISYDFLDIKKYRGYDLDINQTLELLKSYNVKITQLQWVMPMDDKRVFSIEIIEKITNLYKNFNIGTLTLIPLRHIRGKTKFKAIIDSVDLTGFMKGFLQFIQLLYVLRIRVSIDGHSHGINKSYFNNHKQIILSPDGNIYPEFDFLDYKIQSARIGNWKEEDALDRSQLDKDQQLTYKTCHSCSQFHNCGIKYLYRMFNQEPGKKCEEFYKLQDGIVQHYDRLSKYKNLVQAVI
jgi:radical SAM protein with 4Fe4S-binding SPASM domain